MKTSIILGLTSVLLGTLAGLGFQYLNRDTQQEVHLTQLHSEESKPTVLITPAPKLVVETDEALEKISTGTVQEDKKNGVWTYYHPNGKTESTGVFVNDVKVGRWKYYYDNGNLQSSGEYNNAGQKTGHWDAFYSNTNPRSRGVYENDLRVGIWYDWPEENKPNDFWVGEFSSSGIREGEFVFYSNNIPLYKESYQKGELLERTQVTPVQTQQRVTPTFRRRLLP